MTRARSASSAAVRRTMSRAPRAQPADARRDDETNDDPDRAASPSDDALAARGLVVEDILGDLVGCAGGGGMSLLASMPTFLRLT
jgi:hypothetical protein